MVNYEPRPGLHDGHMRSRNMIMGCKTHRKYCMSEHCGVPILGPAGDRHMHTSICQGHVLALITYPIMHQMYVGARNHARNAWKRWQTCTPYEHQDSGKGYTF